jgi:hypothetical protein
MELNLPDDANRKDADKAYLFGLLQAGNTITQVKEKSGYSRDTIYRKIKEYGFKQIWIQTDQTAAQSPPESAKTPPTQSTPTPSAQPNAHHALLEPEVLEKMEVVKAKRKKS